MKAVILCAGLGTRLGSLVNDVPKPMLLINDEPILLYIIKNLVKYKFIDIAINLHYLPECITNYFGDGSKYGVSIKYSYENTLLGTAGALINLKSWLGNDDFIVIYGDVLSDQDLSILVDKHIKEKSFITLLLHKRQMSNSIVKIEENTGKITFFCERPSLKESKILLKQSDHWVNSGIQVLSPRALDYIAKTNAFDLPKDVYSKLYDKEDLYGVPLTANRVAIDSEGRFLYAKKIFGEGDIL